ncbi:MAG: hypothetical protein ABMA14_14330 [Hyphomonadaceae bacterium]
MDEEQLAQALSDFQAIRTSRGASWSEADAAREWSDYRFWRATEVLLERHRILVDYDHSEPGSELLVLSDLDSGNRIAGRTALPARWTRDEVDDFLRKLTPTIPTASERLLDLLAGDEAAEQCIDHSEAQPTADAPVEPGAVRRLEAEVANWWDDE